VRARRNTAGGEAQRRREPVQAQQYDVLSIPTLILFTSGEEQGRVVGAGSKDSIAQALLRDVAA
jgi:predicted DsbA family dithiol-disulfide isomerase